MVEDIIKPVDEIYFRMREHNIKSRFHDKTYVKYCGINGINNPFRDLLIRIKIEICNNIEN